MLERGSPGAPGLEAGQHDRVARIAAVRLDVVQHAPSLEHPARRDDDRRAAAEVQELRVVHGADEGGQPVHVAELCAGHAMLLRVVLVDLGAVHRHRAVQEDRDVGDRARRVEAAQVQEQRLRPADRERREDDDAAPPAHPRHDLAERVGGILGGMDAVAVRRLAHEHVRALERARRPHERVVRTAEIAGEVHPGALDLEPELRGPEDVAGRQEPRDDIAHADIRVERVGAELIECGPRIPLGVERLGRRMAREAVAPGEVGLLLLEMPAVRQDQAAEFLGPLGGVDAATEAVSHECGQVAGVIEVRVGDHHRVDALGRHRERGAVALAEHLIALEEPAVDQDPSVRGLDEIAGSRDGVGRTEEAEPGGGHTAIIAARPGGSRDLGPGAGARRWATVSP